MTTLNTPPTGARAGTPAGQNPSKSEKPIAVRTDQVADLQVLDKKVDANGLPILGATPGLSSRYVGLTGSQILLKMLAEHGVTDAFGYPGGAILPTFDALYDANINFILVRHEQGAGHMADGYARATGKPGVLIVTSGPGATNTVTPLATAYMDSIPIIVFSGQVRTYMIGNDAFQEADVTGIVRPVTKRAYLVKSVKDLPRIINEAFIVATTGRPGPVLVDLPVDVTTSTITEAIDDIPYLPGYKPRVLGHSKMTKAAADAINNSKRPVLYVGGGAVLANAWKEVRELADKANLPCTTTLLGLGTYDEYSPRSLHMLGMHGSAYANYAVQESDCLIAVGARFDDRVTGNLKFFAPKAKIIHIDIDPSSISKNVKVDVPVVGDARLCLRDIIEHVQHVDRKEWFDQIDAWKKKYPFTYRDNTPNTKPQAIIEAINKATQGNAVFATGVGQHQMWAAQFIRWSHPRSMISSGGLGTMGYGVPAAIGAQVGRPGELVIDIDGDASFIMFPQELATAAEYKIPVKIAILNNNFQGMVKQWQELFYKGRLSYTKMTNPDFAKLAEGFGVKGLRCEKKEDVDRVVAEMIAHPGPCVVDFLCEKDEHVYPMVASGKALHEMELGVVGQAAAAAQSAPPNSARELGTLA
ncbi:MAG TPA: biosynthetic-type acetolactate synthase large subunit [Phycisphaerae bacterium]|nr:biosynthetic-type acetolactate synthase large subunit [Phycisphaerae bacterium]